jgi:uncharacterized protein YbjT (DUF2867 family)
VVAVQDWDCVTKLVGGMNVVMLNVHVAEAVPAGESATPMLQVTALGPPPVLIDFGLKSKLVSEGAVMSSGLAATVSVEAGVNGEEGAFPATSTAKTCGVHVPASA